MDTRNMGAMEALFWTEIEKLGATVESFIQRSSRPWWTDKVVYKITRADASVAIGQVDFGLDTWSDLLKVAKGD